MKVLEETAKILHVSKLDEEGTYMIITDRTPFYAESGGQAG